MFIRQFDAFAFVALPEFPLDLNLSGKHLELSNQPKMQSFVHFMQHHRTGFKIYDLVQQLFNIFRRLESSNRQIQIYTQKESVIRTY